MDRIEWIIVDDGTDKIRDLIETSGISNIKYFELDKKMALGEKRNYMHKKAKGSIIVYMDDDDYYPPERIEHAVDKLQNNKEALCAGSSEMYIYFKHIQKMYQCGPYGPNHATAGTFAFKSRLLDDTKYEDHAALAEERAFLKEYTVPFVQLDPMKTILVFSHNHNTFDKKKLLENPHPDFFKESPKTVDDFLKRPSEAAMKQFFLHDIDAILEKYAPGDPIMKPDALEQMRKIEEGRHKMLAEQQQKMLQNAPGISLQEPGKPPRILTMEETIQLIQNQQMELQMLTARNQELERIVVELQTQIMRQTKTSERSQGTDAPTKIEMAPPEKQKSEPDIMISL
jgi:hypothetical protein